jgi:hypothetical protein
MFTLDTAFHILIFKCNGVCISYGISSRITELKVRKFDSTGYFEFDTNIGLEAIDLFDENTPAYMVRRVKRYLCRVKNIRVRCL